MADLLVALTGGIASGKSTVASMLSSMGASVIDSDQIARDVVKPGTTGAESIQSFFGKDLYESGSLDRQKLAEIVFTDPEKRRRLEEILHPLIRTESKARFDQTPGIVVYQIPLLVESAADYDFDTVVTVEAEEETRVSRLKDHRSMSRKEAKSRISSQASRDQRESVADYLVDSDCTLEQLQERVEQLWMFLQEMRDSKMELN